MQSRLATCLTHLLTLTHSDIDHPSDVVENTQFLWATGECVRNTPQDKDARTGFELPFASGGQAYCIAQWPPARYLATLSFLRRLVLPRPMKHWTMTTLREKLIKIGAKVVAYSRYVFFQMAEVAVPRKLFAAILERIQRPRTVASMAPS